MLILIAIQQQVNEVSSKRKISSEMSSMEITEMRQRLFFRKLQLESFDKDFSVPKLFRST